MTKSEHRVSVDSGKYTFVVQPGDIRILRHGEPWIEWVKGDNAIHSALCELDAARVVLAVVRRHVETPVNGAPADVTVALALHDRLVSDRTPPSEWCGVEATPATATVPERCSRCWFAPCRRMFQCREPDATPDAEQIRYWKDGTRLIEACLAGARLADPGDVPFPLVGDEAKLWHSAQVTAYQHALEMMGWTEPPVAEAQPNATADRDRAMFRAFMAMPTAKTLEDLNDMRAEIDDARLGPADRAEVNRVYEQRKAWLLHGAQYETTKP